MLRRHLLGTETKFGVGANRTAVASQLMQKYGYIDIHKNSIDSEKIGVVVLDDAMQVTQSPPITSTFFPLFYGLFHYFLLSYHYEKPGS